MSNLPLLRNALGRHWNTGLWFLSLAVALTAAIGAAQAYDTPRINTLYHFTQQDFPSVGNFEASQLIQASNGDFYGVSAYGGKSSLGFVYRVSRSSGVITHLHDFGFSDGATPRGQLLEASDGFLYGTTEAGGANRSDYCYLGQYYGESGCGTIFKVGLNGGFTKVHDFYTEADGYQSAPSTGMIQASDGNFYGMAMRPFPTGTSSIFKMTPGGTVSVLHLFPADQSQGFQALSGMVEASDGKLYGTMGSGGPVSDGQSACGTVFKAGTDGSFELLHTFTGSDGCTPWAPLLEHSDGKFYGTTQTGGSFAGPCLGVGCGTIFRIAPYGEYELLRALTGTAADGEYPRNSGLVALPDGSMYGALGGNPNAAGYYMPLCTPDGGPSSFSCGTMYRIDPQGNFARVFDFGASNGALGLFPESTLILATDGNLYGTTIGGGGWGQGVVYRYVLNGSTPIVAIDAVDPVGATPSSTISLLGYGFTGTTQVTFGNGTTAIPTSYSVISDNRIDAVVPVTAQSSAPGVSGPLGTTYSPQWFYVSPSIDEITPTSGRVGSGVTLLGAHFNNVQSITFGGGVAATEWSYVTSEDTAISVTVPVGAQTGPITLTTPGGSAESETFTVRRRGRGRDRDEPSASLGGKAGIAVQAPAQAQTLQCAERPDVAQRSAAHCGTSPLAPAD